MAGSVSTRISLASPNTSDDEKFFQHIAIFLNRNVDDNFTNAEEDKSLPLPQSCTALRNEVANSSCQTQSPVA